MQTSLRRIYLALGVICVLTGAVFVGVAAYGIAQGGPERQWVYVRPLSPTPEPVVAGAAETPAPPPLGERPYRLIIEKIGVDAPVATFGLDENAVPEVPYEGGVVAWYNFTAPPGTGGNAVFAGHYTWYGDAVFRHLDDLVPGDIILLRGENGVQLTYEVLSNDSLDPTDPNARSVYAPTGSDTVTLITCDGTFTRDGRPITGGDYDKRRVVRARFVGAVLAEAQDAGQGEQPLSSAD
jgi:LPXTG-site transpeptidase (sortase) family protein